MGGAGRPPQTPRSGCGFWLESDFDTPRLARIIHPNMPPVPAQAERLTVDDYRATPEGARYQLVEGELIMAPAPSLYHQTITGNLHLLLAGFLQKQRLGRVFMAPCDVYLSDHDVVQPDLLFVAQARLSILQEDGVHGAPDLVIEVLSPATAQLDKKTKRRIYARAGVKELWLVDPLLLQIQLYDFARDAAKPVRVVEEDEMFESALLPGLAVSAVGIFMR